jgi:hypothetical protein
MPAKLSPYRLKLQIAVDLGLNPATVMKVMNGGVLQSGPNHSAVLEELRKENPQLYSSQDRLLGAVEDCYRRLNSST